MHYTYRATEDKLAEDLDRIEASGDTIVQVLHKGSRDYLVIARRLDDEGGRD
jgi:hypothetical protein